MPTASKRRVLTAFVTVLMIWPAFHFALARTLKIHPWGLAGWAMYAVYRPRVVGIALWRCDGATPPGCHDPIRVSDLSPSQQMRLARFSRERAAWGSLRPLDDIANDLAPQMRSSSVLRITLADAYLDSSTHRIRQTLEDFDFQRSNETGSRLRRR